MMRKRRTVKGSFTVEAALCVPSAFLVLFMVMQLFVFQHVQREMQTAMNRVIRDLSRYGTVYSQLSSMSSEEADDIIAKIGADSAIARIAGDAYIGYLLRREIRDADWIGWIHGGVSGVSTSGSCLFDEDGKLLITVSYRFSPVSSIPVLGSMPVVQRVAAGSFYGRDRVVRQSDSDEEEEEEEKVFVAENGTVYHRSSTCSYLKLSVRQIETDEIASARNKDGEKYRPCEFCGGNGNGGTVFITDYGNRYHTSLTCGELKRTVRSVTLTEAEESELRACKKCGNKEE